MFPQLINMLTWWQWAILAAAPPAIVALYFLKLKRRPLEVPSTYLWRKSIEDLHVNAIWQRLRRNVLLLLQLLILLLLAMALLRPGWHGRKLSGTRFIYLIDNSASMQATDVAPSRLDEAKRKAGQLIDQMNSGDVGMVVSFSDAARIEQSFTDNRGRLRNSLNAIRPTQRSTSLVEALKVAAGLANPGRSAESERDVRVAEALPAKLVILSDGKFEPVANFSLGNLDPVFMPIGSPQAANVGIVAFSVRRHESQTDVLQPFARLEDFSPRDADVSLELYLDEQLIDAATVSIAAGGSRGVAFADRSVSQGVLRLKAIPKTSACDQLAADNQAWVIVHPPRRAEVLLVTAGNESLQLALQTALATETAHVDIKPLSFLDDTSFAKAAAAGKYDLVIFDRCRPKTMPQANTWFLGSLPPSAGWGTRAKTPVPQIIDVDPSHPIVQWIDMGNVTLSEGTPLTLPPGGSVLVDSDVGPMLAIAPREGFEDLVMGFCLVEEAAGDGKREPQFRTDWPFRASFPVFVLNLLQYLGRGHDALGTESVRPGRPVTLKPPAGRSDLTVRTPTGGHIELAPARPGEFVFTATEELGVYGVYSGDKRVDQFAVNLFDSRESDIRPNLDAILKIGHAEVSADRGWEPARWELWKGLLLLGLAVCVGEWYIYSRRVSL